MLMRFLRSRARIIALSNHVGKELPRPAASLPALQFVMFRGKRLPFASRCPPRYLSVRDMPSCLTDTSVVALVDSNVKLPTKEVHIAIHTTHDGARTLEFAPIAQGRIHRLVLILCCETRKRVFDFMLS